MSALLLALAKSISYIGKQVSLDRGSTALHAVT